MSRNIATSRAHPNIAFIKYWGNQDDALRIPVNDSLSMNLDDLFTQTTVEWRTDLKQHTLLLNGEEQIGQPLERVSRHLTMLQKHLDLNIYAYVESANNFPMGAGIASSASSFAALTLAAVRAATAMLSERELTVLARLGSGSASRSIPEGFVEWYAGGSHETSYAESFAPASHWDIVDIIAVVSSSHKAVGSTEGHRSALTSVLQSSRVADAASRVAICKNAVLERDFTSFAEIVERDSNLMHAIMMTSNPPLFYWLPASVAVMEAVRTARQEGLSVCYTMDAGPNVHCICLRHDKDNVQSLLRSVSGITDIRVAGVGGGAKIVKSGE
ncbi:MAG: diphosphomevalonate decarboxylase [Anaerolineae bacterium]